MLISCLYINLDNTAASACSTTPFEGIQGILFWMFFFFFSIFGVKACHLVTPHKECYVRQRRDVLFFTLNNTSCGPNLSIFPVPSYCIYVIYTALRVHGAHCQKSNSITFKKRQKSPQQISPKVSWWIKSTTSQRENLYFWFYIELPL